MTTQNDIRKSAYKKANGGLIPELTEEEMVELLLTTDGVGYEIKKKVLVILLGNKNG